jgi:hypothetical protein
MQQAMWLTIAALLMSAGAAAHAQDRPSDDIGNGLYSDCTSDTPYSQGTCTAYTNGAATAYAFAGIICLSEHVTFGQVKDVVIQGLSDNPAERQRGSGYLTLKYLAAAFPCKKH